MRPVARTPAQAMDTSWTVFAEYCNEDGARCYCAAKKTRSYTCVHCHLVTAPLVYKNHLCAVCFRSSLLASKQKSCIGMPCDVVHQEHLAIQIQKRKEQEMGNSSTSPPCFSALAVSVSQPPPVHDPWGVHDGCSAQRTITSSWSTPTGRSSTCEPKTCPPLAAPAALPQNEEGDAQHLVVSVSNSSTTPPCVSASVVSVPQPSPDHDPWGIHDGSCAQHVITSSRSTPTGWSPTFKPEACLQLAPPEALPQSAGDVQHLVSVIG